MFEESVSSNWSILVEVIWNGRGTESALYWGVCQGPSFIRVKINTSSKIKQSLNNDLGS